MTRFIGLMGGYFEKLLCAYFLSKIGNVDTICLGRVNSKKKNGCGLKIGERL